MKAKKRKKGVLIKVRKSQRGQPSQKKGLYRDCEVCGTRFYVPLCRIESARTCSIPCRKMAPHRSGKKAIYTFTPHMDALIFKVYREEQPARKDRHVRKLAEAFRMPRWKITRRAREIGAYEPKLKEPVWSGEELRLLKKFAHRHPEVIQRHFKKRGFKRSVTGIILKRKRERMIANLGAYSACQVALGLGVDSHAITRWIEQGLLDATKRGTARTASQGGDIWFIREKDLRKFIIENVGIIDIRKVEKFWFVDLIAHRPAAASEEDAA
jgi:hypothetical protein